MAWAAAIGMAAQAGMGAYSAYQQRKAGEKASEDVLAMSEEQRAQNEALAREGLGYLQGGQEQAAGALSGYGQQAANALHWNTQQGLGALDAGRAGAAAAYQQGAQGSIGAIQQGYGAAQGMLDPVAALSGYGAQAAQGYNPYDLAGQSAGVLSGVSSEALGQRFQADPGYQFRQQQGEQAINRAAAARGGRLSGRTLQELSQFNQGLASQEFGNFAQREMGLASAQLGALGQQAQLSDSASQQRMAAQLGLAQTGYGAIGQQSALNTQAAQLLSGAYSGLGSQLGGLEQGYGQNAANLYGQLGSGQANLFGQTGANLANLYSQTGAQQANLLGGLSGTNTGLTMNSFQGATLPVQYQGGEAAAIGQGFGNLAKLAGAAGGGAAA